MKPGDTVLDGQGRSYQLGQLLGRGSWASSWLVRRELDEAFFVLKVPFAPGELRADLPDNVYVLSREAVLEQARVYEQAGAPFLPRLEERVQLADGRPGFLIARQANSLERRISEGISLAALLQAVLAVTKLSRQLESVGGVVSGVHGHLKPSNVLFNDRGDIVLADVATPAARKLIARAAQIDGVDPWLAPELENASDSAWSAVADTWSLATAVWRCVSAAEGPAWATLAPRTGLDKGTQVALKDRLLERMKIEASNPRFHTRLADRLAVLLARALSKELTPSPPYRFHRVEEFHNRVEEVLDLVRPRVTQVGRVLLERQATKPWFTTDEAIRFSCTVGCTAGVEGHDEVGVGIAIYEIDRDVRVKNMELGYAVERHPSGRYRFGFDVSTLAPGRYRARIAFAIRESTDTPTTADTDFQVRAAPGWVPRMDDAEAPPLELPMAPQPVEDDPASVTPIVPLAAHDDEPRDPPSGPRLVLVEAHTAGPALPVTVDRVTGPRGGFSDRPTNPRATAGDPPTMPRPAPSAVPLPVVVAEPAVVPPAMPVTRVPVEADLPSGPGLPTSWAPPRVASEPAPTAPSSVAAEVAPSIEVAAPSRGPAVVITPPTPPEPVDIAATLARTSEPARRVPDLDVPAPPAVDDRVRRTWSRHELPTRPMKDLEGDEPLLATPEIEEEDENEPSPIERFVQYVKSDPYVAVMLGIAALLLVLLIYIFSARAGS